MDAPLPQRIASRKAVVAVVLTVPLIALLLVAVVAPALKGPRHGERYARVKCASNLRQIGLAIQMYANDYSGQLPTSLEVLITTQDLTSEVFNCPESNDERAVGNTPEALVQDFRKPGHCSYFLVVNANLRWKDVAPTYVLGYEHRENHPNTGVNVLFGDGHAEFLTPAAFDHVLSEIDAAHNPPRP